MANEKIKLLSDYEKQRLEDSHKHIGSKFICKLEKNKKLYRKLLKKSIRLANERPHEIYEKGFETEHIVRQLIKDTIDDVFQLPIEAPSLRNFWKEIGFKIHNKSAHFSYDE